MQLDRREEGGEMGAFNVTVLATAGRGPFRAPRARVDVTLLGSDPCLARQDGDATVKSPRVTDEASPNVLSVGHPSRDTSTVDAQFGTQPRPVMEMTAVRHDAEKW
jgi:hypothetical protein